MEYNKGKYFTNDSEEKKYIKKNFRSQSQCRKNINSVNDLPEQRLLYGIKNFFKKDVFYSSANNYLETGFNSNKIFDQFWPVKSSAESVEDKNINLNLKKSTEDKKIEFDENPKLEDGEVDICKRKIGELVIKNETLKGKVKILEGSKNEVQKLRGELNQNEQKIKKLKSESTLKDVKINEQKNEIEELKNEVKKLKDELDQKNKTINKQSAMIKNFKNALDSFKKSIDDNYVDVANKINNINSIEYHQGLSEKNEDENSIL